MSFHVHQNDDYADREDDNREEDVKEFVEKYNEEDLHARGDGLEEEVFVEEGIEVEEERGRDEDAVPRSLTKWRQYRNNRDRTVETTMTTTQETRA
ncbi:hypothetical protein HZH66_007825 [Vespula vulgaris]|uniref:Uncharacterized protein n=1 Tax=Vespula vulgaris TaxID=7454 RepID=A0A834JZX3_VESVU|nr:hypothetical protein HZH66_007825 [Vespula vulgaris]